MPPRARAASATPRADRALIEAVRAGLRAAADPAKAPRMQAYMKSEMPYFGVGSPEQARLFGAVFPAHRLPDFEAWRDTLLALWREAAHREERYAALDLAGRRAYAAYLTRDALPVFEEFIVTGAWWDYVDETAHLVGEVLRGDRVWMSREMRAWSRDADPWKRRVSIICQLRFRDATDLDLLYTCIEANLDDRAFFIRKAIGWALRQYAWVDPDEVVRFVTAHADRLSPLSKREALKNILKSGAIAAVP
ncbi:MAG: DNA alkylation repair protein [Dehalococcoidia bacterium]